MKYVTKNLQKVNFSFRWQLLTLILTPLLFAIVITILILWKDYVANNQKRKEAFLNDIKTKVTNRIDTHVQNIEALSTINNNTIEDINDQNTSRLKTFFFE